MIDLAGKLITQKSKPFDATLFTDHYGTALKELVDEKRKGHAIIAKEEGRAPSGQVIDLMDALRKSIGDGAGAAKSKSRKKAS